MKKWWTAAGLCAVMSAAACGTPPPSVATEESWSIAESATDHLDTGHEEDHTASAEPVVDEPPIQLDDQGVPGPDITVVDEVTGSDVESDVEPGVDEVIRVDDGSARSELSADVPIDDIASYGATLTLSSGGGDDDPLDTSITIELIVDREAGIGQMVVDPLEVIDDGWIEVHPDVDVVTWVQDATSDHQAVHGLADPSDPSGELVWWEVDDDSFESGPIFWVEPVLTSEALWDLLGSAPDDQRVLDDGWSTSSATFDDGDFGSGADETVVQIMIGATSPVDVTSTTDPEGRTRRLEMSASHESPSIDQPTWAHLVLELDYPGDVQSIAVPVDPRPFDDAVSDTEAADFSERPTIDMKIIGAWERDDELLVSINDSGRVTIVTDRSVLSSTDDFWSLTLTVEGHERIAERLRETGLFDAATLPSDSGRVGPTEAYASMTVDGVRVFTMNEYRTASPHDDGGESDAGRDVAHAAVELLSDLSWLDDADISEPLAPWVPDSMHVTARPGTSTRSGLPPAVEVPAWPYAEPIVAVLAGESTNVYDEPVNEGCLRGDDVAPLFALLTGENHAYLRVEENGQVWELNVTPTIPGSVARSC